METLQDTIEKNFKEHSECLNNITSKLISLETRIHNLESCFKTININKIENKEENIIELKKEMLDIDMENIKKAIIYKDYRSIIYLFKLYYKTKTNEENQYPIRIKSKRIYEYYNNNKWIQDNDAHYIKHTLFTNMQTLFYKFNNLSIMSECNSSELISILSSFPTYVISIIFSCFNKPSKM